MSRKQQGHAIAACWWWHGKSCTCGFDAMRAENRALKARIAAARHGISDALDGLPSDSDPAEILRAALTPPRTKPAKARNHRLLKTGTTVPNEPGHTLVLDEMPSTPARRRGRR